MDARSGNWRAAAVPKQVRTKPVNANQARAYVWKAEEYLAAADDSLEARRLIAATSLAIDAASNAADALTGVRVGRRAAGHDHDEALDLLGQAGADGAEVAKELARLLPLKTRAEYDPADIPRSTAEKTVERARHCVAIARGAVASSGAPPGRTVGGTRPRPG